MAIIPDTLGAALAYLNQSLAGAGALKGEKGDPGPKGDPGEKGETGETGQTGASAYEVALANGFEGSEEDWLNSLTPTNIVTVSNSPFESHAGSFKINEIGGKCEQFSTSGAQLFDGMLEVGSLNPDGTNNTTADAVRSVNYIAVTGGSTITLSNDKGYANYIYEYDEDKQLITYTANATTATLVLNDNTNFIRLRSVTSKVENDLSVKYMLNSGATALPWEPYTGGIPAPNPDYPQEIKKTVVSEIKTHGKNLWSGGDVIGVTQYEGQQVFGVANIIGVSVGDELTISFNPNGYVGSISFLSPVGTGYVESDGTTRVKQQFKLLSMDTNLFYLSVAKDVSYNFTEVQVEYGSAMTDYEPYTESTIKLSKPIELYSIGDVQDVITPNQIKRKYKEVALNGNEYIEQNLVADANGHYFHTSVSGIKPNDYSWTSANACCTRLKQENPSYLWNNDCDGFAIDNTIGNDSQRIRMRFSTGSGLNTIDSLKAKLAEWNTEGYPLTFVLELAEEVTEDLPIADQAALNSLKTFNNLTYVEFDSEVEPTFSGETALTTEGSHILDALAKSNTLTLEYLDAATYICDNLP